MKHGNLLYSLEPSRNAVRKRARASVVRRGPATSPEAGVGPGLGRCISSALLVVESEGAVFDTLSRRTEQGYLPAFTGRFAWGADPALCGRVWRSVALESRFRGAEPLTVLAAALRVLNRQAPSLRRLAVASTIEALIASGGEIGGEGLDCAPDSALSLACDWKAMAEGLLAEWPGSRPFAGARSFLEAVSADCPGVDILVTSSLPEALALRQWEMEGMGTCFMRIAGKERGSPEEYLQTAIASGYDTSPVLVVGSCRSAWLAARTTGSRFFPIVPGREDESWARLSGTFFPAFMAGESVGPGSGFADFLEISCREPTPVA